MIDFSREVVCIMGLPFDVVDMAEAVRRVREAARRREPFVVSTPNLNFVVTARGDEAFRRSVMRSHLCVADGMPIVWISRLLGLPLRDRVSGAGLFEALSGPAEDPLKVFFFGGADGVAQAACKAVNQRGGGMYCVGYESPGFVSADAMSDDERIERINAAAPDFVVVSLGAKKGYEWIDHNHVRLVSPVISYLGAVINFAAGTVRRAPPWLQRMGLEWAWRISEEPVLWRRYAGDSLALLRVVIGSLLPLWCSRVWRRRRPEARVDRRNTDGGRVTIELAGAFGPGNAAAVRQAIAEAWATRPAGIDIDLSRTSDVDAHTLGTLLLLEAHQRDSGSPMRIVGASASVRRQFRYHGADHLLGAD
jgi:N-acetylglucosaminyldiphosphoundecaprenol N-acetyl-beta-D-mannosaminyltransferase